jgi:DNA-binding CsgD family transcriptional regulator
MEKVKESYFKEIKDRLNIGNSQNNLAKNNNIPLMPLQYKYIHNLKNGHFEETEGVARVLGYPDEQFTLEFYYSILHPEDLELVFEMTRKGTEWATINGYILPGQLQLSILHRIKRITGEYAYIYRQSMLYETSGNNIIRTISICSDVTELGIKVLRPTHLCVPKGKGFNYTDVFNNLSEKHYLKLTPREREIAFWATEGYTSNEIANKLKISKHTVDTHRRKIIKKTGIVSTIELTSLLKKDQLS